MSALYPILEWTIYGGMCAATAILGGVCLGIDLPAALLPFGAACGMGVACVKVALEIAQAGRGGG